MTDRRTFLQTGITALALPTIARTAFSLPLSEPSETGQTISPYKIIYDENFQDSVAFANEASKLGADIHGIKGDVTDLWYNDLYHEWKKGPAPIMGMTDEAALFCLEELAKDQRMRVVLRIDHKYISANRIEHVISGITESPREISNLVKDGPAWNIQIASLVMNCTENRATLSPTRLVTELKSPAKDKTSLVSWVIAPVKKA